jgi:hypothetical protein
LLYLAQLSGGQESLGFLQRALSVLTERHRQTTADKLQNSRLKQEISGVYCLLTELYLTDCCFDADAEQLATRYAQQSIEWDQRNPDAYQAMASVLLSQSDRTGEAEQMLLKSVMLWMPQQDLIDSGDYSAQQLKAAVTQFEMCNETPVAMPEHKCRMANAKLWTELGRYQLSVRVLETLQQEMDEDLELWYLIAYNYYCDGARRLWRANSANINSNIIINDDEQQQQQQQQQIEHCVQRVLDSQLSIPEDVEELWAAGYECLLEARQLSEKNPEMMQDQDPEVVRQAVELYGLFERLFGSNDS